MIPVTIKKSQTSVNDYLSGLREQIKANAGLLFPHATKLPAREGFDVVITTYNDSDIEKSSRSPTRYQALLTYPSSSMIDRKDTFAAKGEVGDGVVEALEGLLKVLAEALEDSMLKNAKGMDLIRVGEGGIIDRSLFGKK